MNYSETVKNPFAGQIYTLQARSLLKNYFWV